MPEGPEVTIIAESLKKFIKSKILNINVKHKRYKSKINLLYFKKKLPLIIKNITNKGKFLYIILEKGYSLGFSLGMTGHFWIPKVSKEFKTLEGYVYDNKHNHIEIETTKGSFFFNDPRLFGHFYIFTQAKLQEKLDSLGPDILKDIPKMKQSDFNELFIKIKEQTIIADLLLNQKFISGIGNIYRCEAMYMAKIHPLRNVKSLTNNDKKLLKKYLVKATVDGYKTQKNKLHLYNLKIYGNKNASKIQRKGRTIWYDSKKQTW